MAGIKSLQSIERPRITWNHIAFLFFVVSFIIALWGFWEIQTILWNRVVFSNGEWVNSLPLYLDASLERVEELLFSNALLFTAGIIIIFAISLIMIERLRSDRNWDTTIRLLFRPATTII